MTIHTYRGSLTHLRQAASAWCWTPVVGPARRCCTGARSRALSPGRLDPSWPPRQQAGAAGDSAIDVPERVSMLPTPAEGWVGTPGPDRQPGRGPTSPRCSPSSAKTRGADQSIAYRASYAAVDDSGALALEARRRAGDVGPAATRARRSPTSTTASAFELAGLVVGAAGPGRADELFDLHRTACARTDSAARRRSASASARGNRGKGKPGLDASYLLAAGVSGFGFTAGEVWGVHVGWSGNQVAYAERMYNGHAAARRRRVAAGRRDPARTRRELRHALALRRLRRRIQRAGAPLPPLPAVPPAASADRRARW